MNKYLIYNGYENLSLLDSSSALLNELKIPFEIINDFEYYGGHFGRLIDEDNFFLANAYNIAKASSNNCDLLILEEDAFYNLTLSKNHIEENATLFASIQNTLSKYNLTYNQDTKIVFINDLLIQNLDSIKDKIKTSFNAFSASILHSSRNVCDITFDCKELFNTIDLKILNHELSAYFQYESFNSNLAYKYSALALQKAFDLGSDFVISNSIGVFNILDKKRNKLSKAINRNFLNIPVLFLPQVLLLAFGVKDDTKLAFRYHKVPIDFI